MIPASQKSKTTLVNHDEQGFMHEALHLAEQGLCSTDPNPRVGCVVVQNGQVVGRGAHLRAGEPHAEIHALRDAGDNARGAHVYVTLEPCCHHGRTGPCAEALIAAGVSKVTYAVQDADSKVSGGGADMLHAAGIQVSSGLLMEDAVKLNRGFFSRHRRGRPWLRLKLAISLDGRIAAADGSSQWITGAEARADNQQWRARSSAIMTGAGTASADDPRLNVRTAAAETMTEIRRPLRVVLSTGFSLALDAAMLQLPGQVAVIGCHDNEQAAKLRAAGVVTGVVAAAEDSDRVDLTAAMQWLATMQVNELHVECGPTLAGSLLQAALVDELLIYQANSLLGDRGLPMLKLPQIGSIEQQRRLPTAQQQICGDDRRLLYTLTALDALHDDLAIMRAQRSNNELDPILPSPIGATCLPD